MESESAGAPEGPMAHSSGEVLPTPPADTQWESEGGGNQSQGPEKIPRTLCLWEMEPKVAW